MIFTGRASNYTALLPASHTAETFRLAAGGRKSLDALTVRPCISHKGGALLFKPTLIHAGLAPDEDDCADCWILFVSFVKVDRHGQPVLVAEQYTQADFLARFKENYASFAQASYGNGFLF